MTNTVTLTKTEYEKLIERVTTLEKWIFGKNQILRTIKQYEDEKQSGKLKKLNRVEELFSE